MSSKVVAFDAHAKETPNDGQEDNAPGDSASAEAAAEAFWRHNPKGINVRALFGEQMGQGVVGQRIRALDTNADGYLSRAS